MDADQLFVFSIGNKPFSLLTTRRNFAELIGMAAIRDLEFANEIEAAFVIVTCMQVLHATRPTKLRHSLVAGPL